MAWYEDIIGMKSRVALAEPENEHVHIAALPASAVAVEQPPAAPEPPEEPVPVPVPAASIESVPEMDDQLRQQYIAIVEELGISQPGLLRDAARAWFRDRGTRLYDPKKVHAFLTDQYGKERTFDQTARAPRHVATWGWRPLRQVDSSPSSNDRTFWPYSNGEIWSYNAQPYTKAIPLPVLLTARDVVEKFPTAKLFVSDELHMNELRVDDPFLLVLIDGQAFIIERWDEPAYRE